MKIIRNSSVGFFNMQYDLFAVAKSTHTGKYGYFISSSKRFWSDWQVIYKGKKKQKLFNKYTLPIIWALFNFIVLPFIIIIWYGALEWVFSYFDGMKNFIRNKAWVNNVRYFTWVTMIALIVMSTLYIIK